MIERRTFVRAGLAFPFAAKLACSQDVPNSAGQGRPRLKAPSLACDSHMHIYDPSHFPFVSSSRVAPKDATVPDYRRFQKRIGTTRVVVVTPRNYGTDNRVTVDAISLFAPNARGVAVLHPNVTDADLKHLHAAGVRGIRFSLGDPASAVVTPAMIEPLSNRASDFGWHVQFNVSGDQIVELAGVLNRLPCQMVFDHMANPPLPAGIRHPSHAVMRGLIDKGRAWVKLSGPYSNSRIGAPSYPEAAIIARSFVRAAPERLVWGSDWPHPSLPDDAKPDDAVLLDLLLDWAPVAVTRNRILVENPQALYGFGAG
jgi:D-galactarolactone isomerase